MKKRKKTERAELTLDDFPTAAQLQAELERQVYASSYFRILRSTVSIVLVVAAIALLIANFLFPVMRIYGTSMTPALADGEIVVVVKDAEFSAGQIVAFLFNNKILVKRVIAGPGDVVHIDGDGVVYVNEQPITESYVEELTRGEVTVELPVRVPEERYFLLGDRRDVSLDSRQSAIGCVSQEQIIGRIVFRVWPLKRIGTVGGT